MRIRRAPRGLWGVVVLAACAPAPSVTLSAVDAGPGADAEDAFVAADAWASPLSAAGCAWMEATPLSLSAAAREGPDERWRFDVPSATAVHRFLGGSPDDALDRWFEVELPGPGVWLATALLGAEPAATRHEDLALVLDCGLGLSTQRAVRSPVRLCEAATVWIRVPSPDPALERSLGPLRLEIERVPEPVHLGGAEAPSPFQRRDATADCAERRRDFIPLDVRAERAPVGGPTVLQVTLPEGVVPPYTLDVIGARTVALPPGALSGRLCGGRGVPSCASAFANGDRRHAVFLLPEASDPQAALAYGFEEAPDIWHVRGVHVDGRTSLQGVATSEVNSTARGWAPACLAPDAVDCGPGERCVVGAAEGPHCIPSVDACGAASLALDLSLRPGDAGDRRSPALAVRRGATDDLGRPVEGLVRLASPRGGRLEVIVHYPDAGEEAVPVDATLRWGCDSSAPPVLTLASMRATDTRNTQNGFREVALTTPALAPDEPVFLGLSPVDDEVDGVEISVREVAQDHFERVDGTWDARRRRLGFTTVRLPTEGDLPSWHLLSATDDTGRRWSAAQLGAASEEGGRPEPGESHRSTIDLGWVPRGRHLVSARVVDTWGSILPPAFFRTITLTPGELSEPGRCQGVTCPEGMLCDALFEDTCHPAPAVEITEARLRGRSGREPMGFEARAASERAGAPHLALATVPLDADDRPLGLPIAVGVVTTPGCGVDAALKAVPRISPELDAGRVAGWDVALFDRADGLLWTGTLPAEAPEVAEDGAACSAGRIESCAAGTRCRHARDLSPMGRCAAPSAPRIGTAILRADGRKALLHVRGEGDADTLAFIRLSGRARSGDAAPVTLLERRAITAAPVRAGPFDEVVEVELPDEADGGFAERDWTLVVRDRSGLEAEVEATLDHGDDPICDPQAAVPCPPASTCQPRATPDDATTCGPAAPATVLGGRLVQVLPDGRFEAIAVVERLTSVGGHADACRLLNATGGVLAECSAGYSRQPLLDDSPHRGIVQVFGRAEALDPFEPDSVAALAFDLVSDDGAAPTSVTLERAPPAGSDSERCDVVAPVPTCPIGSECLALDPLRPASGGRCVGPDGACPAR